MTTEKKEDQNRVVRELKRGEQIEVAYQGTPVEVRVGSSVIKIGKPKDLKIIDDPEPNIFNVVDERRLSETNGTEGRVRVKNRGAIILGRGSAFGFRFNPDVSRLHVGIRIQGDKLVIKDLNSLNGTTVITCTS